MIEFDAVRAAVSSAIPAFILLLCAIHLPAFAEAPNGFELDSAAQASIENLVRREIEAHRIPGAVIEIGTRDRILYRRAFGMRETVRARAAMTPDTVFDLASLTKVTATSIAIMQLRDAGRIDLDAPVSRYWPGFARNGKEGITIRHLMTHRSGLRADLDLDRRWEGYEHAILLIEHERPQDPPGTRYRYSDINFEALGEIVRRASGMPLDRYCETYIFKPLGMSDTGFNPPSVLRKRIAPTLETTKVIRIGRVHDPTADRMGGIAGHAGLFSTADDLARLARSLLGAGPTDRARILDDKSIREMTEPWSGPDQAASPRGLGWELGAPFASNREALAPVGSYGHTGFTGTMLWIDPISGIYVIVLANRTYPNGGGDARPLRREILDVVASRLPRLAETEVTARRPELSSYCRALASQSWPVATGADVLAAEGFTELRGKRVALITNRTGVTRSGIGDIEALRNAPGVKLAAIMSPEHGLGGTSEGPIPEEVDPLTSLPVYSLYGRLLHPDDRMLQGIDAIVFDIQDAGARFYTYATTMAYAMEAAARRGLDFYVLDRPDPINANIVQGPTLDAGLESFTGYFAMPTRHGMTMGELAKMFNVEKRIGVRLHVIAMRGYYRDSWYDDTGLKWISPSPNLRSLGAATLYPGVAMIEGANVSVGRGTDRPFEMVGAPWIDGNRLASYLTGLGIEGVEFESVRFIPQSDRHANRECGGVRIVVIDRDRLDSPRLGIELAAALWKLYPKHFDLDSTLGMIGSRRVLDEIKRGSGPLAVAEGWEESLRSFNRIRSRYLLYEARASISLPGSEWLRLTSSSDAR